jgi:hypothetical protein
LARDAGPNDDAGALNLIQQAEIDGVRSRVSGEDDGAPNQSYDA